MNRSINPSSEKRPGQTKPGEVTRLSSLQSTLKGLRRVATGLAAVGVVLGLTPAQAQTVEHGVSAALIQVVQLDNDTNNNAPITVTATVSVNNFHIRNGSNRGDYNVQIGDGFSDDVASGVLMTCLAENARNNDETNYPGINYCTSAIDYSRTGGNAGAYWIPVFQTPTGDEYNMNVAAAFFPYNLWIGGYARNSGATNGGINDLFTGSPGLSLGTHFVDEGGGKSTVNLLGRGIDSRLDGVLLVTAGRNEDNYAMAQVNTTNGTWTIYVKDNGTDAGSYEQDPAAFVFIPRTNTTVISGRFRGEGTPLMFSGATPQFVVTNISVGTWRLTIPGQSPTTGVLIISAEGGLSQNQDNIVTYEPNGDGWIIQSRDLPGNGLQTPSAGTEPVAAFVFVPTGVGVTPLSPPDRAQGIGISPVLQAAVSNGSPSNVTMKFYGRIASVNPAEDFAIVALPDSQFYVANLNGGIPEMFYAQTEWIITNRAARNIAYVAQLGDITQSGDIKGSGPNTTEWRYATNAMYRLENPARTLLPHGIPYGVAVGNHDEEPIDDSTGTTTLYNQYFGIAHFAGRPYYAGHYGTNNNNHFDFFSAGGMDFIVIYFQYDETLNPEWLNWGNDVLRTNQNRRAIIVTHNFGNTATPVNFSAQGAAIYNAIKTNKNVFMMLAGHVTGEGSRVDTYNGNTIRTFVSDYQGWTNGGNGFMRIIDFSPKNNQVVFTTYSPWADEYSTGPTSEIWFNYDMAQPIGTNNAPFELLSTVSNVAPGALVSLVWSNRNYNTAYEWYAVITDAANNVTTGPAWRFTVAPNLGPTASNTLVTIVGDASTNLTLFADDINGDPLKFQTHSAPMRGLNLNFNSTNGTVTYQPARGFRGFDRFTYSANDGFTTSSIVTFNMNIVAPPDTNANGLSDAWESYYGVTNPDADADFDGLTNIQEYLANTSPTNNASVLRITEVSRLSNGHVMLKWSAIGGTRYRVQYSNPTGNGAFTGVFTDIPQPLSNEINSAPEGTESTGSFIDNFTLTAAPTNRARYYRIKVTP